MSARRGLDLACKPSLLATAQRLSMEAVPTILGTTTNLPASLGENQLAHAGGGQAVGAAVVPNLHEAFALQQLLALQGRVQGRRLASSMVGWQI